MEFCSRLSQPAYRSTNTCAQLRNSNEIPGIVSISWLCTYSFDYTISDLNNSNTQTRFQCFTHAVDCQLETTSSYHNLFHPYNGAVFFIWCSIVERIVCQRQKWSSAKAFDEFVVSVHFIWKMIFLNFATSMQSIAIFGFSSLVIGTFCSSFQWHWQIRLKPVWQSCQMTV